MNNDGFAAYDAKCKAARALEAEILPANKQILFDALAGAGIALVTIGFDGSGDSGQFQASSGFDAANTESEVPDTPITVQTVDFETSSIIEIATSIREFVETLACDLLERTHDGWENDDGGEGTFRFDVAERTITLEYNEFYTESNYYEHSF